MTKLSIRSFAYGFVCLWTSLFLFACSLPPRYVIDKGLVVFQGRVQGAGAFIGGDFMLSNPELRPMTFPTVLTFVEVLTLHRLELEEVMMRFPNDAKYVRTGVVWGALKQHLMKVGRESLMKKGDSRRKMIYASLKLGGGSRRASAMGGGLGPGSIDVLRVKAASQAGEDIDQREKQAMSQINESQYSEDSLRSDPIVSLRRARNRPVPILDAQTFVLLFVLLVTAHIVRVYGGVHPSNAGRIPYESQTKCGAVDDRRVATSCQDQQARTETFVDLRCS